MLQTMFSWIRGRKGNQKEVEFPTEHIEQAEQLVETARLDGVKYIRFSTSDLNGITRCKVVPIKDAATFLKRGHTMCMSSWGLDVQSNEAPIPTLLTLGHPDVIIKPMLDTFTYVPWADSGNTKVAQVYCEPICMSGEPLPVDPRYVARLQLDRLQACGFQLLFTQELEFSLLETDGTHPSNMKNGVFLPALPEKYKAAMYDILDKLETSGVAIETWMREYSPGQMEINVKPGTGIAAADNLFLCHQGIKETALQHDLLGTFITKPFSSLNGNGAHFNHSLWTNNGNNAFWDPLFGDNNLSTTAEHWIAGLIAHAPAMTAICCPTVNCYHRLHNPWSPSLINWNFDDRDMLIRVKTRNEKSTYIEGRLPSSAANPYLVTAVYIAAGMDGINRKLQLCPNNHPNAKMLSTTLTGALNALKADKVIVEALGEEFVEWFCILKEKMEINELRQTEGEDIEEQIRKERERYQLFL